MSYVELGKKTDQFSLVSIIVPAYNEEKNIKKCINKLLDQTYKNIEIIIIDDGSKDSTLSICNLIASNDNRVKIFSQPNSGASIARNHGLEVSKGEYIIFVDADDELISNAIELMLQSAIKNQTNIVQGCLEYENKINMQQYTGNNMLIEGKKMLGAILDYNHVSITGVEKRLCYSAHGSCAKLFNRHFLFSNALKFDSNLVLGEDMTFVLQAYSKSEKICILDNLVYKIIVNPNSSTRRFNKKMLKGSLSFIENLNKYLAKEGLAADLDTERCYINFITLLTGIISGVINDTNLRNFFHNVLEINCFCNNETIKYSIIKFLELSKKDKIKIKKKQLFLAFLLHYKMYFIFTILLKASLYLRIAKRILYLNK